MTTTDEVPAGPVRISPAQWDSLAQAYAYPPRAYHSLAHVLAVLVHYRAVEGTVGWQQPGEVFMAVLYHDAIYVPGRSDNEALSAQLAREHLSVWPAAVDSERVAHLIELTARHGRLGVGDVDSDEALFLDCDMAILGADAATFSAYDRAIAAEYRGVVPPWLYRLNRRRFLKSLLGRERIFLSDHFHGLLDAPARNNLRRAVNEKR